MIGKPYSGKPNVRFDEGELEIELSATTPALYSTERNNRGEAQYLPCAYSFSDFKKLRSENHIYHSSPFQVSLRFGKEYSTSE